MERDINICENHQYYKVPLIGTMVFYGAEYWCPFCGQTYDIFGGKKVKMSSSLYRKYALYKNVSSKFLQSVYAKKPIDWKYRRKINEII
jgi:hypothetical protein